MGTVVGLVLGFALNTLGDWLSAHGNTDVVFRVVLQLFTPLILGGFIIYALVPELPLPVALAIAAILSPTDPVAVAAIAKQAKLPPSIMHLVAGESLINDASGLVGFSLIQIALGLLAALFLNLHVELETEWFLLLFIAPLLYSDAWRFPKKELWELRGAIFGNAILLVFITTQRD
ncbi:cation:proton antiporter [Weissella confusa]|uniref:Cation:proton antiporter n=1 Tax=Weissella confusa TaxID=1583 RepID=A0A923NHI1_WEICO|nr:cation:proton antiporter [Weissella confusa]